MTWSLNPNYWPYTNPPPTYEDFTTTMWYNCPYCGRLVQWGGIYCPFCGKKLITEETYEDKLDKLLQKLEELIQTLTSKANLGEK